MLYEYIKIFECPKCHTKQTISFGLKEEDINPTTTVYCGNCEMQRNTVIMKLIETKKVEADIINGKTVILTTTIL